MPIYIWSIIHFRFNVLFTVVKIDFDGCRQHIYRVQASVRCITQQAGYIYIACNNGCIYGMYCIIRPTLYLTWGPFNFCLIPVQLSAYVISGLVSLISINLYNYQLIFGLQKLQAVAI